MSRTTDGLAERGKQGGRQQHSPSLPSRLLRASFPSFFPLSCTTEQAVHSHFRSTPQPTNQPRLLLPPLPSYLWASGRQPTGNGAPCGAERLGALSLPVPLSRSHASERVRGGHSGLLPQTGAKISPRCRKQPT